MDEHARETFLETMMSIPLNTMLLTPRTLSALRRIHIETTGDLLCAAPNVTAAFDLRAAEEAQELRALLALLLDLPEP